MTYQLAIIGTIKTVGFGCTSSLIFIQHWFMVMLHGDLDSAWAISAHHLPMYGVHQSPAQSTQHRHKSTL